MEPRTKKKRVNKRLLLQVLPVSKKRKQENAVMLVARRHYCIHISISSLKAKVAAAAASTLLTLYPIANSISLSYECVCILQNGRHPNPPTIKPCR